MMAFTDGEYFCSKRLTIFSRPFFVCRLFVSSAVEP